MNLHSILWLSIVPRSIDLGLLVLRLALGAGMLFLHGLDKLHHFPAGAGKFPDPLHIGGTASMGLAVFAEVGCAVALSVGLFSRLSALSLTITMGVALFLVHKGQIVSGQGSELAALYLAGFVCLFLTGPGRFSFDSLFFKKS